MKLIQFRLMAVALAITLITGLVAIVPVNLHKSAFSLSNIRTDNATRFATKEQPGSARFVELTEVPQLAVFGRTLCPLCPRPPVIATRWNGQKVALHRIDRQPF